MKLGSVEEVEETGSESESELFGCILAFQVNTAQSLLTVYIYTTNVNYEGKKLGRLAVRTVFPSAEK